MPRLTEMRKKAKIATLTSAALSYIDTHGFATARELGTVLPQMVGMRAISEVMLKVVIENMNGCTTPSGKIVVKLEREHAQPFTVVGAVDPQLLYNALGNYLSLSATCTGTISGGTVYPY
jgi:phosphoglucomutase